MQKVKVFKKKYSAEKEKIRNDHFSQQRSALDWCQCVSAAEIKTEKQTNSRF